MLYIASLNSGSNGNCYYLGSKNEAILVDAGISCRTIERRMKNLNLDLQKIKGIFISHEHTDHIKGVEVFSRKYGIPVYISPSTYRAGKLDIPKEQLFYFGDGACIQVGKIRVHVFSKIHDAADPYSFCATDGEVKVGVFTDIGRCDEQLIEWFSSCNAAFLEANYDARMLADGPYPYHLKKRISGGSGHLSNDISFKLFCEHRPPFMSHLIISHLSQKNNTPEIVENLFKSNCGKVQIIIASRYQETSVYEVKKSVEQKKQARTAKQLTLEF